MVAHGLRLGGELAECNEGMLLREVGEESSGAVLDEVSNELEAFTAAVVGVGDFGVIVLAAEIGEALDAGLLFISLGEFYDVGVVLIVHGEDEVEGLEVIQAELPGVAADLVAALADGAGHAGVRGFAAVEADGARGVDLDAAGESGFFHDVAKDVFSGGGAADVSHADKEDVGLFHELKMW